MSRTQAGFVVSMLMLSFAIVRWPDVFLFSYVYIKPPWVWLKWIPDLFTASDCITLLCLIPAALMPPTLRLSRGALIKTVLCVPVTATFVYAWINMRTENPGELMANALFNYVWVLATVCLLPAILLFALRFAFNGLAKSR